MSEEEISDPNRIVGSPDAEVHIDEDLVRALLRDQVPALADLPLRFIEEGFDNVTYRLGSDKAVRVPRREIAGKFIESEHRWLTKLSAHLPLPIPAPHHCGQPTPVYPWRWSVVPWFEGKPADLAEPDASAAVPLADFMKALHQPAPGNAPSNPFRGVPLADRVPFLAERFERLKTKTDLITEEIDATWREAVSAPVDIEPTWIHGDLHARNILTLNGSIAAVIDWGDMTSGDRATDLASIWMLLGDPEARKTAILSTGPLTDATWTRAKGWAISFGVLLLDSGLIDNQRHAEMGRRTLTRIRQDL